ncbi:UxaA family hydrolase [Fictibacillus terranigra]|uniref:UxaA family hydrolase n=1 Tax=Fictibacillus terranigra TaxID=3058424 RepID=A0ABT8E1X8_9BACL|nr:UxaA family hydrolase [Fictibacillus sp. CENA-BCM004]MDN4071901.1 UxaA family hydrolase [Fictibacillus sp. CENA-BCM004]
MNYKTIMMKPLDHVAIALMDLPQGALIHVRCEEKVHEVELKQDIRFGHKFAVKPIGQGGEILKYGEVIGRAVADIATGEHVHVHNLEGIRGRGDKVESRV